MLFILLLFNVFICQSTLSERYTTFSELEQKIIEWDAEFGQNQNPYPQVNGEGIIFHHEIIGYTGVDNLPIWAIKLSFNANIDEDEPKVLILGQCHAEEIYGLEIAVELIEWLLYPNNEQNSVSSNSIYSVMSTSEIWIIPTHNPEGLNVVHGWYDETNQWRQDESYRKNKYDANQNNVFDYFYGIGDDVDGVDLNRNYDFNWIFGDDFQQVDTGCSANPSYLSNFDYYRGPYPFSEPEIQAIRDFGLNNDFVLSIAYHSSRSGCVAEKVISPWLWDGGKGAPDLEIISRLGVEIASKTPSWNGQSTYYPANSTSRRGNAHDWFYVNTGCIQYLIEVGTSDMQSNDESLIETTIENNMQGLFHLLKRAAGTQIDNGPDKHQITGIVSDENGNPLNDAIVEIVELNGPMLKARKTNDFGRYRRLLIEGTYTLKVSADGYETYFYEFVPSSSVVTVHDVTLIKKPEYNVNFNIEFPDEFDEEVILVFENDFHSDTLFISLDDGVFEYSLSEEVISEGNHQLKIFSENLFPELFDYSIESDTTYNIETKWKGVLLHDDFSNSSNWNSESEWVIDNGRLDSQESKFYNNGINSSIISQEELKLQDSTSKMAVEANLKQELEWDNDAVYFYFTQSESANDTILHISGQNWNNRKYYNSFEMNNPGYLNISISTDPTLNYRGVELNELAILFKPENQCFKGDLNLDGNINVSDILLLVNIIFEVIENDGILYCVSDMNSNEIVNVNDIVLIVEQILNN